MADALKTQGRLRVSLAIVVEGRDDVDAVSRACDALIIPTHGYGINAETWGILEKAYQEKGLLILTDPDLAGERIRKRLSDRFPGSVQCWLTRDDAEKAGDIGIENARPEVIADAVAKALRLAGRQADGSEPEDVGACGDGGSHCYTEVTLNDLAELGLAGGAGSAALREKVSGELGIGYGNAKAMLKKLRGFRIGRDELEETVRKIK